MALAHQVTTRFTQAELHALRARIQGSVISPGDDTLETYDQARLAWNRSVQQSPALIVQAASVEDVLATIGFARANNLGVAVQSTGHGVVRPADDSILLLTNQMSAIRVDPVARTAWVAAGARWGEVLAQTQVYGLAPLLGSSPTVGVAGYTLGGGMGWLARKYGLAADSVRYFEVATASGELVRASAEENPDLFWGLRGGGGSLGVVTGLEFKLYPVSKVYAGNLYYPIDQARQVFARYREWIRTLPDGMTSSILIMNFPPLPQLPDILRGQTYVMVRGCYCGPEEEGAALVKPWRDWQAPRIDMFGSMPFSEAASISADPVDPLPALGSGAWLGSLDDEVVEILLRAAVPQGGPPSLIKAEVRHAGGAISRVSPEAAAYGHRDEELILQVVGLTPTPEAYRSVAGHIAAMRTELHPYLSAGVYMNFLEGVESQARIREAYSPEAYQRLQELKQRYDPGDMFAYSFNIRANGG